MSITLSNILETQLRFLFFRSAPISVKQNFWPYLGFVLIVSWLVGIGRYWDHPSAEIWQYLGLGSVAYVFCLSLLLFLVVLPLGPSNWQYRGVLIFVGLTSMPAILYAIPVERFVDLGAAQTINASFLGFVALWRVALLFRYLSTNAGLHWFQVLIVVLLLLSGIVVTLTLLNLEHVVFDLMAGIREDNSSPNDAAYLVVLSLAFLSVFAFPVALVLYLGAVVQRQRRRRG